MPRLFVESYSNFDFWNKIQITSDDFVFPVDNFTDQWLSDIIKNNTIPAGLISEYSFYKHPDFDIDHIGLPIWLEVEVANSKKFVFADPVIDTQFNFNFMINKKRLTRFLLCKCIELYDLRNYDYTWSGDGREFDLSSLIDDIQRSQYLSQREKTFMLSGITIPAKFIEFNNHDLGPYFNLGFWQSDLCKIFNKSAVSLITETIEDHQQAAMFTEKTLFSVLGFTFPVWVGSFAQAEHWKEMGFDAFDDIIDHSYQYEKSILDRVVRAIKDNLDLLRDTNFAHEQRRLCEPRFKNNKKLLLSGKVSEYTNSKINGLSPAARKACEIARIVYSQKINGVYDLG